MKTIAVIDKHPVVRAGLEIFIQNNFSDVTIIEFDSFHHFNKDSIDDLPELFIVGSTIELPSNQCKIITKLKNKSRLIKIIIYDDNPDFLKISQYFKSGVTGYLTKRSDMTDLYKCISEVQNEKSYISDEIMEILLPRWLSPVEDPSFKNKITLTNREFEIAGYLINGDTISEISKKIQREISTIRTIKKNLFHKLKITNLVDLKDSLQKSIDSYLA
jgi:two-component system invasion response regulator UvrY